MGEMEMRDFKLGETTTDDVVMKKDSKTWFKELKEYNYVYQHQHNGPYGQLRAYKFLFCTDKENSHVIVAEIIAGPNKRCVVINYNEKRGTFRVTKTCKDWVDAMRNLGLVANEYSSKAPWYKWPEKLLKEYESILIATDLKLGLYSKWLKNKELNWYGLETINTHESMTQKEG